MSWLPDVSTADAHISSSLEIDVCADWRLPLDDAWKLDLGLYTYYYPGDYARGIPRPHATEAYAGISGSIFSLKYSHSLTNTFGFADSRHSDYIDASANWKIRPSWLLSGHVGPQRIKNTDRASYSDWKLGITRNLADGFALALHFFDTNADASIYTNPHGEFLGRSAAVLRATKTF
ncbi:MAG: TorF family putative porin [Dokdonella sp.]